MAKRKTELGLGRGLDALLGDPDLPAQGEGSVSLPISQVEPGLNQPRKRFDQEALAELTDSIRVHGIIQPLTVRRLASGYYQIIAGERRWRAAKAAGLAEVPAVIIEADDRKVMELGLIENLQREDLNPVEEARGYQVLMEEYGLTQEQVAQRMGKSRPAIANTLRLLALPEDLLALVEEGALSAGHARAILGAPTAALQREAAKQVVERQLSVRQTEALVRALQREKQGKPSRRPGPTWPSTWGRRRKDLSGRLGRKVTICPQGQKGPHRAGVLRRPGPGGPAAAAPAPPAGRGWRIWPARPRTPPPSPPGSPPRAGRRPAPGQAATAAPPVGVPVSGHPALPPPFSCCCSPM